MTRHRYDAYGVTGLGLDEARSVIEKALEFAFTERESGYFAGTYYRYRLESGKEVVLFNNFDTSRSTWVRERYKEYSLVLEVSDLPDMDEVQRRLLVSWSGIALLRTSTIDDPEHAT